MLLNNTNSSANVVGLAFVSSKWPQGATLSIYSRIMNVSTAILVDVTFASGGVQLFFAKDIVNSIKSSTAFELVLEVICTVSNLTLTRFDFEMTNFTLLNLREPDTAMLVDRFVNYSVSDSTLSALFVDQFDFRSNKEYNINVENVVFTNYMSNILIYMSNILVSMVSLHSLVIRECIFRDNAYASLVELNSFSLNGRDTFFVNSYETYHLSYSKFQFVRDTFLLKDYGSKNSRVIVKYNSNCSHNYLIEFEIKLIIIKNETL